MCLKASGNVLSKIAKFNLPAAMRAEYLFQKDAVCEAVGLENAS